MATPLSALAVYEHTVLAECDGQAVLNVMHYTAGPGTGPLDASMEDLLDALSTKWTSLVLPLINNSYSVNSHKLVSYITIEAGAEGNLQRIKPFAQALKGVAGTQVGTQGAGFNSTFDAVNLRKVTASVLRAYRGSMRIGPPSDAVVVDNEITGGARPSYDSMAANYLTPVTFAGGADGEAKMVVFSRSLAVATIDPSSAPANFTLTVNSLIPSYIISSQVSRKRRNQPQ